MSSWRGDPIPWDGAKSADMETHSGFGKDTCNISLGTKDAVGNVWSARITQAVSYELGIQGHQDASIAKQRTQGTTVPN